MLSKRDVVLLVLVLILLLGIVQWKAYPLVITGPVGLLLLVLLVVTLIRG